MASGFWRRHWTTVALSLAALVAVALYAFGERGRVTSREATRRDGQLLPAWRRADLTALSVELPGHASLRLERDAGDAGELDFHMLEPAAGSEIDAVAVDHLLTALEFAPVVRRLEAPPAAFGTIAARVAIAMGTLQYSFELGGDASVPPGARYLAVTRASGAAAEVVGTYVVPGSFVTDLLASAHGYRSKQVVPYLSIALDALTITTKGGAPLRLDRIDQVSFRIASTKVRASRKRIDAIWAALAETRIESFAETAAVETQLAAAVAEPELTVVLQPEQGPRAELLYGGPCPGHPEQRAILRTSPSRLLGCVPNEALAGFATTADALADRGLFALYADEIAEVSAERGAVRFELAREGSGFRRRGGDPKLLDPDEEASFDAALAFLFAEHGGAVLSSAPTFEPSAKLRVVGGRGAPGGGELIEEVLLGTCAVPPHAGLPCAQRKGDGAHVLLPQAAMIRATPTYDWMRSANLGLPSERAAHIVLDCGTPQTLAWTDGGYAYEGTAPGAIDQNRALELADYLRRFRASGFVFAEADVASDFSEAQCRLSLAPPTDAGAKVEIELGWDRGGSHVLGRVLGRPGLWLADAELRTLAERIYLRRSFWNESAGIEELVVTQGGQRKVERRGDAGTARLDAATGFRATDVVHRGPPKPDEGFARPWLVVEARSDGVRHELTIAREPTTDGALVRFSGVDATFSASVDALAPLLRVAPAAPEDTSP